MAVTPELFTALLAMESYNRGYGAGVDLNSAGASNTQIGSAVLGSKSTDAAAGIPNGSSVGFYAHSYTWAGKTVISYRGTNLDSAASAAADILNGWVTGLGFAASQAQMAESFYTAVTNQSVNAGVNANTILTGHSLGGGLAGYISALTGTQGVGFDHMPFGLAARSAQSSFPTPRSCAPCRKRHLPAGSPRGGIRRVTTSMS